MRPHDHEEAEAHAIPERPTHHGAFATYLAGLMIVVAVIYLLDAALQLNGK